MHFEVVTSKRDGWTVVSVIGELDLATAPALRQRVVTLVTEGYNHLLVDLGATDFLDSIGLGVLVGALKRVEQSGGELVVTTDVQRIRQVFELTRLDNIVSIYPDVDSAVAALGKRRHE